MIDSEKIDAPSLRRSSLSSTRQRARVWILLFLPLAVGRSADIPKPSDAPLPLPPAQAQKAFRLPPGFQITAVATEPLVVEPTGVCWDEQGRLYVCELHGYNLEGQLEIEEINKTGTLDLKIQRIQAAEKFKHAAQAGTYGTVKRLLDSRGDGFIDTVQVLASNLPPAYGICPARGGIIVAGQAEIIFLGQLDINGHPGIRETLFSGFKSGALERGINAPQWGPEGWIYFGRGWGAGTITGPHLAQPVNLPNTDFRIRPDGSAIEPVGAGTHTIGFAFSPEGDRLFTTTWKHALYAIPIAWRYFERNPNAAAPSLEADASDYTTVFPIAPVHPWKKRRSHDPGWKELYGAYGIAESAESGYFTSCCSPLIYQSASFPQGYQGNLFVCEPAQNLVHRSVIERNGPALKVHRAVGEETREFLASTDSWFRPVFLAHAPDESIVIVDMYREIIEDYSAVPRFMQQQYGLNHGSQHGRIWKLAPVAKPKNNPAPNLAALTVSELGRELRSPNYWRRLTAERLLGEKGPAGAAILKQKTGTLDELNETLLHSAEGVNRAIAILRANDHLLRTDSSATAKIARLTSGCDDPRLLLQAALSLGYSEDQRASQALLALAREHGDVRWLPEALLTGLRNRAGSILTSLLDDPGRYGTILLAPLCRSIAARGDSKEITRTIRSIAASPSAVSKARCLEGLRNLKPSQISEEAARIFAPLLQDEDIAVRGLAASLGGRLKIVESSVLSGLLDQASIEVLDAKVATDKRLAALSLISADDDVSRVRTLAPGWNNAPPVLRSAMVEAFFSKPARLIQLVEAFEKFELPVSALSSFQRVRLLERADSHLRPRVETLLAKQPKKDLGELQERYVHALKGPRDAAKGGELFKSLCANCHRVKDIGTAVGPDLSQAFQRSEETLVRDILAPNDTISSSYETYVVRTRGGEEYSGVLVSDGSTSVTLRMAGGAEETVLRKEIAEMKGSPVSLMPEGFEQALSPQDCANLLGWLRQTLTQK